MPRNPRTPQDPALQTLRQRLRRELRRYRTVAGLTQRGVAEAMDWSPSKVMRIESGRVTISTIDLRALLTHYGVKDAGTVSRLITLAKESKKSSAGQPSNDHDSAAAGYLRDEAAASVIRQYEPLLIPSLLQTEQYLRAVAADARLQDGPEIERLVHERLERQEVLARAEPAEMFFILDEAVLRRQVGGVGTMPRQLRHLAELGARRNISIQIVPFGGGAYPGLLGSFVLLDFGNDNSLLYLEGRSGTLVRDDADEVGSYLDHFQQLQHKLATEPDQLRDVLARLA